MWNCYSPQITFRHPTPPQYSRKIMSRRTFFPFFLRIEMRAHAVKHVLLKTLPLPGRKQCVTFVGMYSRTKRGGRGRKGVGGRLVAQARRRRRRRRRRSRSRRAFTPSGAEGTELLYSVVFRRPGQFRGTGFDNYLAEFPPKLLH